MLINNKFENVGLFFRVYEPRIIIEKEIGNNIVIHIGVTSTKYMDSYMYRREITNFRKVIITKAMR